jgi:hypothetical protein
MQTIIELQAEVIRLQKLLLIQHGIIKQDAPDARKVIGTRATRLHSYKPVGYINEASKRNAGAAYGLTTQQFKQRLAAEFNEAVANNIPLYTDMAEALKPYGIKVMVWWKHRLYNELSKYEQYVLRGLFYNPAVLQSIQTKLNQHK